MDEAEIAQIESADWRWEGTRSASARRLPHMLLDMPAARLYPSAEYFALEQTLT